MDGGGRGGADKDRIGGREGGAGGGGRDRRPHRVGWGRGGKGAGREGGDRHGGWGWGVGADRLTESRGEAVGQRQSGGWKGR